MAVVRRLDIVERSQRMACRRLEGTRRSACDCGGVEDVGGGGDEDDDEEGDDELLLASLTTGNNKTKESI